MGTAEAKRIARYEANINLRTSLVESIAQIHGIGMPRRDSDTDSHSSSDSEDRLNIEVDGKAIKPTIEQYSKAGKKLSQNLPKKAAEYFEDILKEDILGKKVEDEPFIRGLHV